MVHGRANKCRWRDPRVTAETVGGEPWLCVFRTSRKIGGVTFQAMGSNRMKGTNVVKHRGVVAAFTVLGKTMGHMVGGGHIILRVAAVATGAQTAIVPDGGPIVTPFARQRQMGAGEGKPRSIVARHVLSNAPHQVVFFMALFTGHPQLTPMGIHMAPAAPADSKIFGRPPHGVTAGTRGLGVGPHQGITRFFSMIKGEPLFEGVQMLRPMTIVAPRFPGPTKLALMGIPMTGGAEGGGLRKPSNS